MKNVLTVLRCCSCVQNDPNSGMTRDGARLFGELLEAGGAFVLALALGVATIVEVRVVQAVTRPPQDDEHEDYKIRTEARRLEDMKAAVEEQAVVLASLAEAHELKLKEQEDVRAMHHQTKEGKTNATTMRIANPIHSDLDEAEEDQTE